MDAALKSVPTFTPAGFREAAWALVQEASTLTLATQGPSGAWSTPVYYVCVKHRFYFFSSPQSRHIEEALDSGQVAASLFHPADTWQAIRGLQMSGHLQRVHAMSLAFKVISRYLKRFPFTQTFFPETPEPDAAAFFSHFKVRLYAFTPQEVFYTDNRFGFGTRERIEWTV